MTRNYGKPEDCKFYAAGQPLLLYKPLADMFGIPAALLLNQVKYWMKKSSNFRENVPWVYKTYPEWHKEFYFMGKNTIFRAISKLEKSGVLISETKFNKLKFDRTKWYTINFKKLSELEEVQMKKEAARQEEKSKWEEGTGTRLPQNGEMRNPRVPKMGKYSPQNGKISFTQNGEDDTRRLPRDSGTEITKETLKSPLEKVSSKSPLKSTEPPPPPVSLRPVPVKEVVRTYPESIETVIQTVTTRFPGKTVAWKCDYICNHSPVGNLLHTSFPNLFQDSRDLARLWTRWRKNPGTAEHSPARIIIMAMYSLLDGPFDGVDDIELFFEMTRDENFIPGILEAIQKHALQFIRKVDNAVAFLDPDEMRLGLCEVIGVFLFEETFGSALALADHFPGRFSLDEIEQENLKVPEPLPPEEVEVAVSEALQEFLGPEEKQEAE